MLNFLSIWLFATSVSLDKAKEVANNFYNHYSNKSNVKVSDVVTYQKEGLTTFYVFIYDQNGYVIISADDAVTPVLGYSVNENFDKNNIPVNTKKWFESYSSQIKYIVDNNLSNRITAKEWSKIQNNVFEKSNLAVTPLCTTTWDQGCYYNAMCPADAGAMWTCGRVYTGCVATAMAQIMKFWNYPTNGVGTFTYTDPTYGAQTVDFGNTTYNWGSMPNNVTSSNTAVATLMYHCGVSVKMTYGTSGSGAYSWDVPNALISYFNYSPTAEIKFLADFTSQNWITMLKTELDAGRPVYYSGTDGSAGHAFVCDGYDNTNKFHFNWGWSGSSNGYYAIGSLNPAGSNFNLDNSAIIRIKPPSSAPIADFTADVTTPPVGGTVNFTNNSTNNPTTYSWVFDGGTPATSTLQTPPPIVYNTMGVYQVSLTVTNGNGTDTKTRSSYINVGGTPSAWIKQNTGFTNVSRGIDEIEIVNPYIVWAKAYDGTAPTNYIREFTRTVNGGITWTPGTITFTNSTNYGVSNIFPMNDTVAYACMFPITGTGGAIVKTIDAGLTWTVQTTAPFTGSWANFVYFFNVNDGVAMGDPASTDFFIYTTTDGGNTWTQVSVASLPNSLSGEAGITNMYDVNGNTVWFGTTKGRIYKSTDKGYTWTVTSTGLGTSAVVTPIFKDANTGIVTATNATTGAYIGIARTTNGGSNWTTITPTGFYVKNPHIDNVPGTAAMWFDVSPGAGLGSSYSLDDCSTFLNIDTGSVQYTTVSAYDFNTAWAGGFNASSSDGGIYKWNSSVITSAPAVVNVNAEEISVFPNPTSDVLNIKFNIITNNNVVANIYNLLGEKVLSFNIKTGTTNSSINISELKNGVYVLSIDDGQKITTKKISKLE